MKHVANILSILFHPVFIPTIITGCFYFLNADFFLPIERFVATGQAFLMTFLLPICIYFFLKSLGLLKSSIMIRNVRERSVPIFVNILIINVLIFKIWADVSNSSLKVFFIGYCISYSILFFSVLLKRKYSVHVASLCSAIPLFVNQTTTYYLNPFFVLPILLILIGLVASSRLYLRAHTHVEIIVGALIGFVPSFILFYSM
ncbi:hypothetical protein MG290_07530 [Flavobacterium sp. CBA20B-1]|uniref:hypothetical protein n=1 Tax=unclassified Flavobacterium TaxID=196869 RepID=UPI00222411BF|nr:MULTISPECIES: hypothetical protein [unclassified Flavobacterium]WCM40829.1 hypothetical protein MG290_07530 [Flavobacterium sp. CBA20B-1]